MIDFLRSAEEQLKLNKDKTAVMTELGDHFETKKEFFESIGYDETASTEKANEAMGDGEIIGQRLNQIHNRKLKIAAISILSSVGINLALNAAILLADKSNYSVPFAAALFILIFNLSLTYVAIKIKNVWLSAVLMPFSCVAAWLSLPYLSYPFGNLIIARFGSDSINIYNFLTVAISAFLWALVFLPNVFNAYHCRRIKRLKNTKKQNHISKTLRCICLAAGVLILVISYPYYAMNNRLSEEQAKIRDELMDFAFETVNDYIFNDKEELEEFLENCKYDFHATYTQVYSDPVKEPRVYTYTYRIGNWQIKFDFYNSQLPAYFSVREGYGISISNILFNVSQRYLITSTDNNEKLFDFIQKPKFNPLWETPLFSQSFRNGLRAEKIPSSLSYVGPIERPYVPQFIDLDIYYPHQYFISPISVTAEDIKNTFNKISLLGVELIKNGESTEYVYKWQGRDISNSLFVYSYNFYCQDDWACTGYFLTEDYSTLK